MSFRAELALAGLRFSVEAKGALTAARMQRRFEGFLATESTLDETIALELEVDPAAALPQPEEAEWPGCHGQRQEDGRLVFRRRGLRLVYDPATRRAQGLAHPSNERIAPAADPTALDTPLRLLLSWELPRHDGLLLHACGYAEPRGAILFTGRSGIGKTTTARKLAHHFLLSDDLCAVRRNAGRWDAYALPFVGEYGRPTRQRSAPLRRLYLLAQAARRATRPLPPGEGLAQLMRCVAVFVHGDPGTARLLDLALDLVAQVPPQRLALDRDGTVDDLVQEALACSA